MRSENDKGRNGERVGSLQSGRRRLRRQARGRRVETAETAAWVAYLREHRASPLALLRVVLRAWVSGTRKSAGLTRIRKSFRRWATAAFVIVMALSGLLLVRFPHVTVVSAVVLSWVWFIAIANYVSSQLFLVIAPGSRRHYRSFLLPNGLTLLRLLSFPLLACGLALHSQDPLLDSVWFVFFSASAATDILDGAAARVLGLKSEWGRITDHITDVLFGCLMSVAAAVGGLFPLWFCALAFLRFLLPPLGGGLLMLQLHGAQVRPTLVGKATVFVLAVTTAVAMYPVHDPQLDRIRVWLVAAAALASALNIAYLVHRGRRASNRNRAS